MTIFSAAAAPDHNATIEAAAIATAPCFHMFMKPSRSFSTDGTLARPLARRQGGSGFVEDMGNRSIEGWRKYIFLEK
jgi:hypothetical protein